MTLDDLRFSMSRRRLSFSMVRTFIARAKVSLAVRHWSRSSFSVLIFLVKAVISSRPEFAVGDTVAGATFGVEEVLEVGVLVRELVALQPASSASVTMSSWPTI